MQYAQLVEGYGAVLYKRKLLEHFSIKEIESYPKECFFADDFVLSNFLNKNGIPIIVSSTETVVDAFLEHGNQEDALRNGAHNQTKGNLENYKKCAHYMSKQGNLHIQHHW